MSLINLIEYKKLFLFQFWGFLKYSLLNENENEKENQIL